jgi:tRNA threonylcarbamoyladenosine biosynthesis protein TsaB
MRVLAVDTATAVCGVALWEDDRIVSRSCMSQGPPHTQVLMQAIDEVLQRAGVSPAAIDAFVISQGPGSFTGLRIGIGTVKGLAVATGKPVVGISTLSVLAHQAPDGTALVCPMIDARRGEVYWSVYRRSSQGLVALTPECAGAPSDIRIEQEESCLFIGSGARLYASVLQANRPARSFFAEPVHHQADPNVLARLGVLRLRLGRTEDAQRLTPVYLRPSDAELTQPKA